MPNATAPKLRRWFLKCRDCLSVVAVDSERQPEYGEERRNAFGDVVHRAFFPGGICGACEGKLRVMGDLRLGRVVQSWMTTPCDARCTSATGPSCECSCGGKNHGTGRLVEVVTGSEPAPPLTPVNVGKAREIAAEFRSAAAEARAAIEARYGDVLEAKRRGDWIPSWGTYLDARDELHRLSKAKTLKTRAGRLKALRRITQDMKGTA